MKPIYWVGIGVTVLGGIVWLWGAASGPATPTSLASQALTASDPKERINAAVELAMLKGPNASAQLRRVAQESKDPEVIVRAVASLPELSGLDNTKLCLTLLEHGDSAVREAALQAFRKVAGIPFDVELSYDPADPDSQRAVAVRKLSERYAKTGADVAAGPVMFPVGPKSRRTPQPGPSSPAPEPKSTAASTSPTSKDPAVPPKLAMPTPLPSPTVPPSVSLPPTGPLEENHAIQFLAKMCQVLAAILLLADMAGAALLVIGLMKARTPAKVSSHAKSATVKEEIERILAANSTGLWAKMAMLTAGALSVVALLITAEMMQLAMRAEQRAARVEQALLQIQQMAIQAQQSAGRVEQKVDSLSHKLLVPPESK